MLHGYVRGREGIGYVTYVCYMDMLEEGKEPERPGSSYAALPAGPPEGPCLRSGRVRCLLVRLVGHCSRKPPPPCAGYDPRRSGAITTIRACPSGLPPTCTPPTCACAADASLHVKPPSLSRTRSRGRVAEGGLHLPLLHNLRHRRAEAGGGAHAGGLAPDVCTKERLPVLLRAALCPPARHTRGKHHVQDGPPSAFTRLEDTDVPALR